MIIPGGIGTGRNNIGVPILERLVKRLSNDFDITVFSLFAVNGDYNPGSFKLISISANNPLLRAFKLLNAFRRINREKKFRVVHGFWAFPSGFLAVLIGKTFGIRSVVSVLGGDAIYLPEIGYGQLQPGIRCQLVLWTLNYADEVILLTNYLLNNLRRIGFRRKNVKIIPYGVDPLVFTFREKLVTEPFRFIHVANLHPVKDQETLLKAFKIISDQLPSRLTIIGEGVSDKKIRLLISELTLQSKVEIIGLKQYEELVLNYHDADILLHTSLSEGQGMVLAEAMSCGVLVCGTNVGLLYDLPECCVSVPVCDYQSLASETLKIIADLDKVSEIRQKANDWANSHSIVWTVEKIKECYKCE